MNAPDWAIPHLRPDERVVWWCRPSMIGLIPIFASTVGAVAYLVAELRFGLRAPMFMEGTPALALAAVGIVAEFVRRFLRLRYTSFVITEERLYAVTSFFTTNVRSVPLSRAMHVTLRQGPFGRLFGYWTARVTTYGDERAGVEVPAIRDGEGLLREMADGMSRGANVSWLLRGD